MTLSEKLGTLTLEEILKLHQEGYTVVKDNNHNYYNNGREFIIGKVERIEA